LQAAREAQLAQARSHVRVRILHRGTRC
jgi:hypothetical protein